VDIYEIAVDPMEASMLREHVINFIEAAVLMVINAFSVATAAYALSLVGGARVDQPRGSGRARPRTWWTAMCHW
jgi:hypothetical protein